MAKPDAVFIYIGTYPCTATACMHLRQASRVRAQAHGRAGQGVALRGRPGRFLKRQASKYSFRKAGQVRRPTRRVPAKVLTLHPAIVQQVKQRHCTPSG